MAPVERGGRDGRSRLTWLALTFFLRFRPCFYFISFLFIFPILLILVLAALPYNTAILAPLRSLDAFHGVLVCGRILLEIGVHSEIENGDMLLCGEMHLRVAFVPPKTFRE